MDWHAYSLMLLPLLPPVLLLFFGTFKPMHTSSFSVLLIYSYLFRWALPVWYALAFIMHSNVHSKCTHVLYITRLQSSADSSATNLLGEWNRISKKKIREKYSILECMRSSSRSIYVRFDQPTDSFELFCRTKRNRLTNHSPFFFNCD